ncbi:MAG TPA: metallophosphoesterase family protein [Actinomycetota bacterium]
MRTAVLSDIHANLEALEAVMERIDALSVDQTFVLGDIVGYCADPNAVVERLGSLPSVVLLAGNHDLAATGRFDRSWFNTVAEQALAWTARVLEERTHAVLAPLEPSGRRGDATLLVHGSPREPVTEYVTNASVAQESFAAQSFDLCFFGHTHVPVAYVREGRRVSRLALPDGERVPFARPGTRVMLNPGSVGQPRDGDPRASFLIVEDEETAQVVRVDYDVARTQEKIRAAGLPEMLASRLEVGR